MKHWKNIGFIATAVIVLSFPVYLLRSSIQQPGLQYHADVPYYTGSPSCLECHKLEYDLWKESHHYHAMDTASSTSVLGDFNNAVFKRNGVESRFFIKEGKYYVETPGPGGEMGIFEIAYTFGYTPLQQYLIPFPGGRLQCLPITWDTEQKRWYHLGDSVYAGEKILPEDWLYWTNNGQNWNGMCADCHSTQLKKGYDPETKTFTTTWFEINVGCEACHGPASEHLIWAQLPETSRPRNNNTALVVKTSGITTRQYVDLCARCHSRRGVLEDFDISYPDVLDYIIPQNIGEPYYYADGQILEEDYVHASFLQSKMFANDVKCNDCHNVHSGKRLLDDNALCLQCHKAADYEAYDHHFHKYPGEAGDPVILTGRRYEVGEGAQCINCHMTGRYYMGPDFRNDHSFRIPRPDLTRDIGVPNACNQCHADKNVVWAINQMSEWYGKSRKPHYGSILAAGRAMDTSAVDGLIRLAFDTLYPVVARASAIELLNAFPDEKSAIAIGDLLSDNESIIRFAAVQSYTNLDQKNYLRDLISMLYDPVKAVRINAAFKLSSEPTGQIDTLHQKAYQQALQEYIQAMEYTADFPASRHNLGILYGNLGEFEKAVENYTGALRIDDKFYPAKMNLAMVYNQMGDNIKAGIIFRDIIKNHPGVHEALYSFGLLLAEMQNYSEAVIYLKKATQYIPDRPRIYYNLGLLQNFLEQFDEAERSLLKSLELDPGNSDYLYALTDFYMKRQNYSAAEEYALKLKEALPENPVGDDLLNMIRDFKQ